MSGALSCRAAVIALALWALPIPAHAQTEGVPAPSPEAEPALERAKDLFRRGNELRKSGDCQAALPLYLASRELVASAANTMNAAYCMHQLHREDEALDLYEELLSRFPTDLTEQDRSAIAPEMLSLRRSLGTLEVSANVTGAVVIDGRMRGKLPLLAPLRLTAGRHLVRVIKDGFETFERAVDSEAGKTAVIDAVLTRLERSGGLRIECPDLPGANVFIDGANLGVCPYEGALLPGPHLVWTRLGARGSDPMRLEVILGQTTLATAASAPLGPELRFLVSPATATLTLNGLSLGGSSFQGPLTLGEHVFMAQEAGYRQGRVPVSGERGGEIILTLEVDESHPRWASANEEPPAGVFAIGADAAFALLASEGGDAARGCYGDCSTSLPLGVRGLVRGTWTSMIGVGVGLEVGGQFIRATAADRTIGLEPVGLPELKNRGRVTQHLDWASFVAGATVFYRRGGEWPITIGSGVGFSLGGVAVSREGDFTNSSGTAYAIFQTHNSAATYFYVRPEAQVARSLGQGLELTLGVSLAPFVGLTVPVWDNRSIVPTSPMKEDRGDGGAVFATESLTGDMLLVAQTALGVRWEIR